MSGRRQMPEWAAQLITWTRRRAKKAGLCFDLKAADMVHLIHRSGGRCEVTGCVFSFAKYGSAAKRPFAPSIDRIDSDKGYTRENCRLVVYAANAAMNEWGVPILITLLESLRGKACRKRKLHWSTRKRIGLYTRQPDLFDQAGPLNVKSLPD